MKKSEIVLINHQGLKLASGLQIQSPSPPIGLAYIGSYIKKKCNAMSVMTVIS